MITRSFETKMIGNFILNNNFKELKKIISK